MEAIVHALLNRVTFVTPGVPALVAVVVAEDKLNPYVSQLADKGVEGGSGCALRIKQKINSFHPLPSMVS